MDWYPRYPGHYDRDTLCLSLAEHGAYCKLIDYYMQTEKPLPDDDRALAAILRVGVDEWKNLSANVRVFFHTENGRLHRQECDSWIGKSRARLHWSIWQRTREIVFERDGYACVYCGSEDLLECDHVIPKARGGSDEIDNLATACQTCNRSKRDKPLSEWLAQRVIQ